uniref:WGS project CAEQ00000000 data, annotated contig 31 n=1 Tax=Trypanosoma congolense (strain IL3000) TaxID=1068625 RepID=F9WET6_TRYCI|nr:unnamed protein product [Trypanosoma congolense IL3000]
MEKLLQKGHECCFDCGSRRSFRISRFGCVFACCCSNKLLDVQSVLQNYVEEVCKGMRLNEFLPVVSGRIHTDKFKIAQVELDFANKCVCLSFRNTSALDALEIVKGLPHTLGEWLMTAEGDYQCSIDALDFLLHELRMASDTVDGFLHVNEPSESCREAITGIKETKEFPLEDFVPPRLLAALHRHQVYGICRALSLGGRVMFADEMGVGKTLQAIGTLAAVKAYPALIVCPAALRHMWVEELEKWLMDTLSMDDIHVITSSSGFLSLKDDPKVVVTSFHMASALATHIRSRQWETVIVDESHILHTTVDESGDARYTSLLCEVGKRSKYCILLTGTPSLSTPFDLFNQVDMLSPGLLGSSRFEFALRYCRSEFSPYFKVLECTRCVELHSLLKATCMIRRMKSETLADLPTKQRIILRLPAAKTFFPQRSTSIFQKAYAENWIANREKILETVDLLLSKYAKIVLFAHHISLLETLTIHINKKKLTWIRIDGSTPMNSRQELLSSFNNGDICVAIIGITACAVGIQLTGASCALFTELPPDVTWLQQAEDRLHRPGQTRCVVLYYIVSTGSFFDGTHFLRLSNSFQAIRRVTDGEDSSLIASYETSVISVCDTLLEGECSDPGAYHTTSFSNMTGFPAPLRFRISHNTGRIHVACEDKFLTSMSPKEAQQYWSQSGDFCEQLREFLTNVDMLTTVERRKLRVAAVWLTSNFSWRPEEPRWKTTSRYTRDDLLLGRVFFWKVSRRHFPERVYRGLLAPSGSRFIPTCLECNSVLAFPSFVSPGDVVPIENDITMFCSGACRSAFYVKRSSSAARRGVQEADRGICSVCQVDCELIYMLVSAAGSRKNREDVLEKLHPQLRHHPALFNRIVEHPTPGNIWNADHILPVSQGGGAANIDNLQTLCVACHADKTSKEAKMYHKHSTVGSQLTTVAMASVHFTYPSKRRVTAARLCT